MSIIEPIQIKRSKNPKFTEKRNPYKKYQKAKWEWIDVFLSNVYHQYCYFFIIKKVIMLTVLLNFKK